jgi:hypothetical protein
MMRMRSGRVNRRWFLRSLCGSGAIALAKSSMLAKPLVTATPTGQGIKSDAAKVSLPHYTLTTTAAYSSTVWYYVIVDQK